MTLYTSGDWTIDSQFILTKAVFDFMCDKFAVLKTNDTEVEVNQVDLTDDNAFGFCQVDEDGEFLVHIHNDLTPEPYVTTLIHELVHVKQTLTGLFDYDRREEEAEIWEFILSNKFWDTFQSATFYHTPWGNRVYNKNVINQGVH